MSTSFVQQFLKKVNPHNSIQMDRFSWAHALLNAQRTLHGSQSLLVEMADSAMDASQVTPLGLTDLENYGVLQRMHKRADWLVDIQHLQPVFTNSCCAPCQAVHHRATKGVLNNIYVGDIYVHRSFAVNDIIKDPDAV